MLQCYSCCSYPAVLVVPHQVSDDSILRVVKNHRQMRFPVATWKNRVNKAVLLRSAAIERSSVASIIRTGVAASGGSTDTIRSSNVEQDKYLTSVGKSWLIRIFDSKCLLAHVTGLRIENAFKHLE